MPLCLSADQTWDCSGVDYVTITANKAISGIHSLALNSNSNYETWALNSGNSTFTGGVTVSGTNSILAVGASSSGPPGSLTSGPVGTGPLVLGDGTTLATSTPSPVTLANAVTLGDQTTGCPVTLGNPSDQPGTAPSSLTFTGPVTLVGYTDPELTIDIGSNSTVTFASDLTASTPSLWLDLSGGMNGNSLAIIQGNLTNVTGTAL